MKELDLKEEILLSYSKANTVRIAKLIDQDEELFQKLIGIYFDTNDIDLAKKAAWILSHCIRKYPFLIKPYIKKLIRFISRPGLHDALKRNGLKSLELSPIGAKYFGQLSDVCFRIIISGKEPVAIKAYSIGILEKIGDEIPEIRQELKLVLQDIMPYESAGFQSRARKVLAK